MSIEKLGRYEILEEIGRGAMGVVYLAYDPQIKRKIAVKAIKIEQMADHAEQKEFKLRFQREAQLAGNLSHPNIIAIHDVGEDKGISYIAMELVEGKSLAHIMVDNRAFSIEEIIDIFNQICQAMNSQEGVSNPLQAEHKFQTATNFTYEQLFNFAFKSWYIRY